MLIVSGSETKKSLGWFCKVEVFMIRVKLPFWWTLLQLSSTTGLQTSNLTERLTKLKSNKGRKTFYRRRWKPALQKPVDNRQFSLFRETAQYINL